MSWFSGSSSSWGASLFTSTVDTTQRKEDKPMPKVAAKSLMRDWEVQCYGTADDNENVEKPTWDPFLSLEESEAFEKRMSTMRQMRDIGELGETSGLKSYEQQVLGAHHTHTKSKTKKMPASEGDTGPTVVEDEDQLVGMDKVIDGQTLSVAVPWSLWPQQTTEWKNADSYATLIPDTESFGIAFYVKDKPPMYYEAACELELSRGLDSPGSAGMCFHLKPGRGNAGMRSYIFYLQFLEGEDDSAKLVVAKLSGQSSREMPETLRDLKEVNCTDGWHYFRVRSFHGGLMFYFDFQYVGFMEVGDDSLARRGLLGVWAWDMEVNVRKAVVRNLEDMDVVDHGDSEREEAIKAAQREHRVLMFRKARAARLIQTAVRVAIRSRRERMAPYLEFEGAEMLAARKRVLLVWLCTFNTLQRFCEVLDDPDITEKRMQKYLEMLDRTCPPPPPPPLEPPPTQEDEELHYLYEMQQRKYQKQIEHAGRKVLGEKLQALKNMTDGSLAYQQKELVAQMQKKKAQEATTEKEHQALKQMAKRLMSNFGEMKDLVPTVKHFRATRDAA